jgi:hypothetical protein
MSTSISSLVAVLLVFGASSKWKRVALSVPVPEAELLTATAEPLYVGRSTQVWEIDVRDERGKRVCVSRCTLAIVPLDRRGGA